MAKALTGLAALALVLAVVGSVTGEWFAGTSSGAFSRASSNLALLAIALIVAFEETPRSRAL